MPAKGSTSSPATRLDPRLPLVKDAEDTVEVRRFDQAVPAVRVQCAAPPARVAVRVLIRLMMAHLNPKALQHVVEPEIELRLDALAERIARASSGTFVTRPSSHSISVIARMVQAPSDTGLSAQPDPYPYGRT